LRQPPLRARRALGLLLTVSLAPVEPDSVHRLMSPRDDAVPGAARRAIVRRGGIEDFRAERIDRLTAVAAHRRPCRVRWRRWGPVLAAQSPASRPAGPNALARPAHGRRDL